MRPMIGTESPPRGLKIDAVIFDAGETLVHPHPSFPELLARFINDRGHSVGVADVLVAEAALAEALSRWQGSARGWSTTPEASREFWAGLYRELLRHLDIDDPDLPDRLYERFTLPENYALFEDALPALTELRSRGYRLGVVSNWQAWLEGLLTSLEVMPMLDALVVSGIEGVEKPDPRIFQIALERIGVPAERTCYVGDSPAFDVEAARAVGMQALLIDRRGRHDPSVWPVIGSLTEIPGVIA